ncbi:MAG: deoxyribose-phosphate aldolase [Candidatus Blackburnbacteria bacterium]|nr:deoxyribose-phosphate aldolase [Candidatus Blackburnbacteria bacterium]
MINEHIEHTNVKIGVGKDDVVRLCDEALKNNFRSVVVPPYHVKLAKSLINTHSKCVSVIDFPIGNSTALGKILQAKEAVADGADEIDIPMNVSAFRSGDYDVVAKDIKEVVLASHRPVKVIIEASTLTSEEVKLACNIVMSTGATYVKSHTGFAGKVKKEDIILMKEAVQGKLKVKASGGIKTFEDAMSMFDAGADLVGTSDSLNVIKDAKPITYLSGVIYGAPQDEVAQWRKDMIKKLEGKVFCLDPMRKPYETMPDKYKEYGREIVEQDKLDIDISDFLVVKWDRPSVGTSMEILYAWQQKKPVYVWTNKTRASPWLGYHSTKFFENETDLLNYVQERHCK